MKGFLFALFAVVLLAGTGLSWRYGRRMNPRLVPSPGEMTLSDLSGFEPVSGSGRTVRYVPTANAEAPYARIVIPGFAPQGFECRIRFRARPDLLRVSSLCLAGETRPLAFSVKGDVGEYSEIVRDSAPYMQGRLCIIGIHCPKCYLRDGDRIELLDFHINPF